VTLLERLRALYPEASGRSLKQWLEAGRVEVNGQPARDGRRAVAAGDTVALAARRAAPFPRGLSLVLVDDAIVVVVKPSGLLSIATIASETAPRTACSGTIWPPSAAPFIVTG
jgi:23S rRNA-/tRNA-specific pseudouridylate synthase